MTNTPRTLIIGTRGSDLAMWQTRTVASLMTRKVEVRTVTTTGDRRQDIALQGGTQTGFFTKEIEDRLLGGEIDIAVHSLKDLPTQIVEGLTVPACIPRAPYSDLLLVHPDWHEPSNLLPIRKGARVGAGSLRRQSLIRLYAPDTNPDLIRGNVPTRVGKCRSLDYGAIVLARAGVERLELDLRDLYVYELEPTLWLPAPGQGAVAVEVRQTDIEAIEAVKAIEDRPTMEAVNLERALLAAFEGGCHTAFGALARKEKDQWRVLIGIDRGHAGWGQREYVGDVKTLSALGPAEAPSFKAPVATSQEELCRPFRP